MVLLLLIIFLAIMLIGTPVGFAMGALTNISFGILGGDQSMVAQKLSLKRRDSWRRSCFPVLTPTPMCVSCSSFWQRI